MKKSQLKKIIKEEIKNTLKEGREHSSNVEAHELLDMIQDELEDLEPSSDLIIRVSMSSPPDGSDYGYGGYDVEFETLGRDEGSLDHMFKGTTPDDIDF